jgi:aspartate/methionine/tyrosine aminotransferase
MTRLAEEHGAINLAQGMPDFDAPPGVKRAAIKAIAEGFNQYETTWGSQKLREAIAEKALRFNRIQADPATEVTVTCGSTEAMTASIIATTDAGDEVIIPEPFYENYVPATIIGGGRPRHVRFRESGPSFDEEELKAAFSSRTKAIIINTPNNPAGKVLTRDELRLVADLCVDFDALAITDEIYEHIVYDGRKHVSMASLDNMRERTITISGLSKTYSVTGWRVGYAIASKEITNAIRKVHDYTTVCAPAPFQKAGVEALKLPHSYYARLAKEYQERRDYVVKSLRNVGFNTTNPEGAYYILADFSSISAEDDTSFAHRITKDAKVAAVPGSSFFSHRALGRTKVRFSFAKKNQTLHEAMKRLDRFFRLK